MTVKHHNFNLYRITGVVTNYGSEDIRVPLIHGEKMRDKLRSLGKTVEWMVMTGEGHGWVKESNNILWGETMLRFVDQYIGKNAAKTDTPNSATTK